MIEHGQTVGFSAFTPAGSAKAIPRAISERAKTEHTAGRSYQIRVLTGASTGESLDGALASANAISFRAPWQNDKTLRALINSRQVPYLICISLACSKRFGTDPWVRSTGPLSRPAM